MSTSISLEKGGAERDRETERQRQRDTETERERERQRDRDREGERDGARERERERDRDRETKRQESPSKVSLANNSLYACSLGCCVSQRSQGKHAACGSPWKVLKDLVVLRELLPDAPIPQEAGKNK